MRALSPEFTRKKDHSSAPGPKASVETSAGREPGLPLYLHGKLTNDATLELGQQDQASQNSINPDDPSISGTPNEKGKLTSPFFYGVKELEGVFEGRLAVGAGASGEFVQRIQFALLADDPTALPKFHADGHYGQETQAAVVRYQKKHALAADGVVGRKTLGRMDSLLYRWSPQDQSSAGALPALTTVTTYRKVLHPPLPGDEVRAFANFHKIGITTPFALSGGTETGFDFQTAKSWDKFKLREESSELKVAAKNSGETNDFSTFYVNDAMTEENFVNLMLGRFVSGVGPENFVFPLNGRVSNQMRDAMIVENAVAQWYLENYEAVLSRSLVDSKSPGGSFGVMEQIGTLMVNWGILNIPQFVGSARVTIEFLVSDDLGMRSDQLLVTIRNVTSATSGDILKHLPLAAAAPSFPRDSTLAEPQQYTNISQTFQFTIPVDKKKAATIKQMPKPWR